MVSILRNFHLRVVSDCSSLQWAKRKIKSCVPAERAAVELHGAGNEDEAGAQLLQHNHTLSLQLYTMKKRGPKPSVSQCCGYMKFWTMRMRILLFSSVSVKTPTKNYLFFIFCLLLFEGTFNPFFKDKKLQNSRNQWFYYFCLMIEGSGSVSLTTHYWIQIPIKEGPGGPKPYGSYGSGSATQV